MKPNYLSYLLIIVIGFSITLAMPLFSKSIKKASNKPVVETSKTLRHVVLFKFKEGTSEEKLKAIETAFAELPTKIPEIIDFEWGTNNSPEGLDKGFTHCFFVSFASEKSREIYLPHPDHKAFVDIASPHIEDVMVVDYWASAE